jgi:hypothetical protein
LAYATKKALFLNVDTVNDNKELAHWFGDKAKDWFFTKLGVGFIDLETNDLLRLL